MNFSPGSAGDQTRGIEHARQILCRGATFPALKEHTCVCIYLGMLIYSLIVNH